MPGHPESGTTGQWSGQRQPGVAWPARLTHPTKPAWPAGCGDWLASRPAGRPAGCSLVPGWLAAGWLSDCLALRLATPAGRSAGQAARWPGRGLAGAQPGRPVGRLAWDVDGWLAGWLEGDLAGWAGWLTVCLAGWRTGWFTGSPCGCMATWLARARPASYLENLAVAEECRLHAAIGLPSPKSAK
jgi:hypothetical protein